jgi:hypothetical protein
LGVVWVRLGMDRINPRAERSPQLVGLPLWIF